MAAPNSMPSGMSLASLALALRLARRELRGGLKGFRIFLACLTLGVAAIAAVQSVSSGLMEGLRADGGVLLGGDIAGRSVQTPFNAEQLGWFAERSRLSQGAELRSMLRRGDEERSSLVELKAVDGAYPLYGRIGLGAGTPEPERSVDPAGLAETLAKRDGRWGAVIEPTLAERLDLKVGDDLRLGDHAFELRAILLREPDRASSGAFVLGPRMMVAFDSLADSGLVQPGSLIQWTVRAVLPEGGDPKALITAAEAQFPDAGWRLRDASRASPQIERFIDRMTLFLTLVGLTALLVGGVGVGNAVSSHLESRARTIATLKCLGAPGALVFQVYLIQILALALLGIVLGIVLGALAPLALGELLSGVLPVSLRIGPQPMALTLAAVYGLLTALVFSLWPLGRARDVPAAALFRDLVAPSGRLPRPRYLAAIAVAVVALAAVAILTAQNRFFAGWFVVGAVVSILVFRLAASAVVALAARLPRPRRPGLRLALANLHRPGNATSTVVLSLGLGLTVLVAIALIEGNFSRRVNETIPRDAPSFFFIDIQPNQLQPLRTVLESTPGTSRFEAVPSLRGRIDTVNGKSAEQALVDPEQRWILSGDRGITYSAEQPVNSEIVAGKWWPTDRKNGPPLVSIHDSVARAFAIGPGDRLGVNILGRVIEAEVANVREADFATLAINFTVVFAPGLLEGAPQTWIATIRTPADAEAAVQRGVLAQFPNITAIRIRDAVESVNGMLGNIGVAVRVVAAVTLAAGMLVLAGAIVAGHRRRVYDAVIFKVLGASRGELLRGFLLEYGLLGLLTAMIAGILGSLAAWAVLIWIMRWEWTFLPSAVMSTAVIAVLITLAFGFAGTWRALGRPAAPLLRND